MSAATVTPYRSDLRAGRNEFAQLLRAEWTKFRTVRGWVIGVIIAPLLIVGIALLDHSSCGGAVTPGGSSSPGCPAPPVGPGGETVTDSFYLVHQPLTGNGSITVRVTSLTGQAPPPAAVVQGRDHHQGGHAAGIGVRGDDGHRRPRGADAVRLHR